MARTEDQPLLILKRTPVAKDGERAFVEHDGVTLTSLSVGLHDDLVIHARHRPGERGGPGREVDVAPPKAELGTSTVA